jgi:hypothetical protein
MSVNPRKFKRKNNKLKNISEIKDKLELESNLIYLDLLKFDLKHARKHAKLQILIHKKQGWRDYTC